VITSELLEAYLACPTKCYLKSNGEKCSENKFAGWYETQKESYLRAGIRRLEAAGPPQGAARSQIEPRGFRKAEWRLAFNQALDVDDLSATIHAIQRAPTEGRSSEFIPIRFVHLNKPSRANKMMAVFDAIVLSKAAGQPISVARVIHGDAWTTMKVRVAAHVHELTKTFGKMRVLLAAASPPDLVLNRHCPECEFRYRCREKAIEKDDLSLLTGLTDKDRIRLNRRGIFTVKQLSHTFRPRRRPKRLAAQSEKYHHSLRALALREKRYISLENYGHQFKVRLFSSTLNRSRTAISITWLASELRSMDVQRTTVFGQTHYRTNGQFGLISLQSYRRSKSRS
jgi:predicted RecB family nuclease